MDIVGLGNSHLKTIIPIITIEILREMGRKLFVYWCISILGGKFPDQ